MHIGEKSRDYVSTIVDELLTRFNVKKWVPCHCTGFPAAAELYCREQDVHLGRVGMNLSL
jgi:metal-dependent hydrolase (beta-lactamase superfamily II)